MSAARRPKRNRIQKKLEYNEGMLWQEERDLRRALYASIQEKKPKEDGDYISEDGDCDESSNEPPSISTSMDCSNSSSMCSCDAGVEACMQQQQQQQQQVKQEPERRSPGTQQQAETTTMCLRRHQDSSSAYRQRDSRPIVCEKQHQQQQQQQQQQQTKCRQSERSMCKESNEVTQGTTPTPQEDTRKGLRAKRGRKSSEDLASLKLPTASDAAAGCSKPKKARLRAQRKFAESLPCSPSTTPAKNSLNNGNGSSSSSNKGMLFDFCPQTEDFLTFLCLRGTPALPPHLDFFEVAKKHQAQRASDSKEESRSTEKNNKFVENNFHIPGIEPLPTDYPHMSVTRLESTKKAIRRRKNVASSTQSSIPPSTDINGNQQLPPCLSPIPPPIAAIPRCRHPPPLTPIEPVTDLESCKSRNSKTSKQKALGTHGSSTSVPAGKPNQKLPPPPTSNKVVRDKSCTLLKPVLRNGKNRKCVDIAQLKSKAAHALNNNYAKLKKSHKANPNRLPGRKKAAKPVEDCTTATFEPPMLRNKRKTIELDGIIIENTLADYKRRKLQELTEKSSLKLLRNSKQCLQKKLRNHVRTVNSMALHSKHKHINNHVINNNTLEQLPLQLPPSSKLIKLDPGTAENKDQPLVVKRGRGRPPGSKNKVRPLNKQQPIKSTSACRFHSRITGHHKTPSCTHVSGPTISTKAATHSAPVFFPSQEEWKDPIAYITSISAQVAPSGMCKVVPPQGWMPECKLKDDMRLTPLIQRIHRLHHRWGSNVQQLACIKKHLAAQDNDMTYPPQVGGCELDLVRFSRIVTQQGGRKTLTNKKRWNRVADLLKIPKMIQGRIGKLDGIYCKYLLSYDTLTKEEKEKLCAEVEAERKKQSGKRGAKDCLEDCSYGSVLDRGRSLNLTQFCKMANNFQKMQFKNDPSPAEVEREYWRAVEGGQSHISVQKADIDTAISGSGFPHRKTDPFAKHNWNLNNVGNNHGNLLQVLPSKRCINLPEMKVGMLYSTETWNCDRHALPSIQYLHTGAPRIHYCIPRSHQEKVVQAMQTLVPSLCAKKPHCLHDKSFLCMVPPQSLAEVGIPVYRLEQRSGEFLVTLPGACTSSVSCGYNVAETIHYATPSWVSPGIQAFQIASKLHQACDFSIEQLLSLLRTKTGNSLGSKKLFKVLQPELKAIRDQELEGRRRLAAVGLNSSIRFAEPESPSRGRDRRGKTPSQSSEEKRCCICQQMCYVSMVLHEKEGKVYCLNHALELAQRGKLNRNYKLMYRYDEGQLDSLVCDPQAPRERQSPSKRASPSRRSLLRNQDNSSSSSPSSSRETR